MRRIGYIRGVRTASDRRVRCVVVVALAVGSFAGFGVTPALADVAGRHLTLDVPSPPSVYEDNPTTLTGELSPSSGGKRIDIQEETATGWSSAASTRTAADGSFSVVFVPPDPGTVHLRAVHRSGASRQVSDVQSLTVLDRRVYLLTKADYDTFTTIAVTGRVVPGLPGRHIVIQHLTDGRWVDGATGSTQSDGRYSITLRDNRPGPWTVRAYWPGSDPAHGTAEYSGAHEFTVHAVLQAVVTPVTRAQLGKSWHPGCPVGAAELRNITMTFHSFGSTVERGTLVVRDTIVDRSIAIFGIALAHGFPIRRMRPTADYDGSDISSMFHDNTSAFNCRDVTGEPGVLSPHAYGNAVDVDPVENPYMDLHGTWWPRSIGHEYRSRKIHRAGMLYGDSTLTQAFVSRGFRWGGVWDHPDYQHFDTDTSGGPEQLVAPGGLRPPSTHRWSGGD